MTDRNRHPAINPHMNMALDDWIRINPIPDTALFKKAALDQLDFVRGYLVSLAGGGDVGQFVVGEHTSKSIKLPVYHLKRGDLGLDVYLRGNFYDWKLSVRGKEPINVNLDGLCRTKPPIDPKYTGDELAAVYFEGFAASLIFRYYDTSSRKQWSASLPNDHALYTALFLVMRSIGAVKPLAWETRPVETRPLGRK